MTTGTSQSVSKKKQLSPRAKAVRERQREKLLAKREKFAQKIGSEKKCSKCGTIKPLEDFGQNSSSADGYQTYCRSCKNNLQKTKRQKDIIFRMKHHMLTRMHNHLNQTPKDFNENLEHYLGYPLTQLKRHLKAQVKEDFHITVQQAFREGFHVDHITPLTSFGCTEIDTPEGLQKFRECWHYTNLKAIPAEKNLKKGSKSIEDLDFEY